MAYSARELDPDDREVSRTIAIEAATYGGMRTAGELLDHLGAMSQSKRREVLNRARTGVGLDTVEDAEAHARFVSANQAIVRRPRPVPECAICGARPTKGNGLPDLNVPQVRKWHCPEHVAQAEPGDMEPPPSPVSLSMRLLDPDEIAREQEKDEARREQEERRRQEREAEAELVRRARERYEANVAENDYVRPKIAGIDGVRMEAPG